MIKFLLSSCKNYLSLLIYWLLDLCLIILRILKICYYWLITIYKVKCRLLIKIFLSKILIIYWWILWPRSLTIYIAGSIFILSFINKILKIIILIKLKINLIWVWFVIQANQRLKIIGILQSCLTEIYTCISYKRKWTT